MILKHLWTRPSPPKALLGVMPYGVDPTFCAFVAKQVADAVLHADEGGHFPVARADAEPFPSPNFAAGQSAPKAITSPTPNATVTPPLAS